ncbi:membrane-associated phosphatidylinositol transfer protein 1 isoform X2 [Macaca mulatta]
MLIKEYHILLPMSLDEYQVAQLYMIQKKSREESSGEGSGVEILANRPYTDGPGGSGQYTHKVYHVGSHIPGWFRALLPKAALQVEEESWNAYPYTRTRYTCPFVEKFSIEIETYYLPDGGQQPNVFNLSGAERRQRILDTIDIVRDAVAPGEYKAEEDPRLYRSVKTGRGPLADDWARTAAQTGPLMCAYKLCKVEFRYWGMQAKIEQFIHDVGLRRVMLRAHRQAWCWQDEWTELSMADIRALEEETARMLAQRMAKCNTGSEGSEAQPPGKPSTEARSGASNTGTPDGPEAPAGPDASPDASFGKQWSSSSRSSYSSQHGGAVSPQSLSEWRMQNIARDSENSSEEEFFDAHEGFSDSEEVFPKEMTKWNSNDFIDAFASPMEAEGTPEPGAEAAKGIEDGAQAPRDSEGPDGAGDLGTETCAVHALFLILHSGNILDSGPGDANSKQADVQTLSSAFEAVTRIHFPEALGHVALRLVPCPPICAAAYALVSNLSPYSHDGDSLSRSQDHIPLAALPLLATSSSRYQGAVATVIARTNQAYSAFLRSPEGAGFCGQVVLIGDGVGGILGFDALCHSANAGTGSRGSSRRGSMNNELLSPEVGPVRDPLADGVEGLGRASPEPSALPAQRIPSDMASPEPEGSQNSLQAAPATTSTGEPRRASTASCPPAASSEAPDGPSSTARLDFKISGFFLFGSPLGLVLALRKTVMPALEVAQMRPACEQIYNLFHAADPCASRLEPLLAPKFQAIAPLTVPRYQKFPLGDGSSLLLADTLQTHSSLFLEELEMLVPSTPTSTSGAFWKGSELATEPPAQPAAPSTTSEVVKILERWWGTKRIDYSLYCPEALTAFPTVTLPHLFHASYWESADVVAFILRQVIEKERPQLAECEEPSIYSPAFPREKWQRKRTQVKIRVGALPLAPTPPHQRGPVPPPSTPPPGALANPTLSQSYPSPGVLALPHCPSPAPANSWSPRPLPHPHPLPLPKHPHLFLAADSRPLLPPERHFQPPGERHGSVRGPPPGAERALHVWAPGRRHAHRREGGCLHHDAAAVGQVDPLWHRGHQQLRPPHLRSSPRARPGHRGLPRAHGGQGRPHLRRMLPDCGGPRHGGRGLQHRRLLHRQRLHHGQRPQGARWRRGCGQALAGLRLPDRVCHRPAGYAEAPRGGLAVAAQLPPWRRLLLRWPHPRPAAPEGSVSAEPGAGGRTEHRGRLWVSQRCGCIRSAGPVPKPDLHRGPCRAEATGAVPVPVRWLRGPSGPAGSGLALACLLGTPKGCLGQKQLWCGCPCGLPAQTEPTASLQRSKPGGS